MVTGLCVLEMLFLHRRGAHFLFHLLPSVSVPLALQSENENRANGQICVPSDTKVGGGEINQMIVDRCPKPNELEAGAGVTVTN